MEIIEVVRQSPFFWVMITLTGFYLGTVLNKKFKTLIFNELLLSVMVVIIVMKLTKTDYNSYMEGGKYISFLLTPATAGLGVKLYKNVKEIGKNSIPIISGMIMGVLSSLFAMWILKIIFNLTEGQYATILPISVTAAIATGISESLNGNIAITVATVKLTGIFIGVFGKLLVKIFKIKDPIALGVALGISGHGQGTAIALKFSETAGAVASLSMCISALITVFIAPIWFNFTV